MADITRTRNHNLATDELKKRLDQLGDEMKKSFGIKFQWDGDVCHLSGAALKGGTLTMSPDTVKLELTLGMMARMLKPQIEKEIDARIEKIFAS
jgi:putative polyhydroxyalkanoate system protein